MTDTTSTTPESLDNILKNEVSCSENIIRYIICVPVDLDDAVRLSAVGKGYVDGGQGQYILIDIQQSTKFSSAARKIWVEFLQNDKIKKTAIFGGNLFVKTLATFVITATGRKEVKFFNSEAEAVAWFKE